LPHRRKLVLDREEVLEITALLEGDEAEDPPS